MLLLDIAEWLAIILAILCLVTQVIIPAFLPAIWGPDFFWLFRRKSTRRRIEKLKEAIAQTDEEREAEELAAELARRQRKKETPRVVVTPPPAQAPPPTETGEDQTLAE